MTNNRLFKNEYVHGVQKWLGYSNRSFTIMKYLSLMHPVHLAAQMPVAYELLETFMSGLLPLEFMGHRFASRVALRHASGEYLLFKRLALPFQLDDKGRLLGYLNEFTLIARFNNEPYTARMTDAAGRPLDPHCMPLQVIV